MLKPLLQCLQQYGDKMVGATVIDKIVGLAAAYLCIIGGVARVVTPLASLSAQKILQQHDIQLQAWRITPLIMNRENTGPCPMEQLASTFDTPEAFFQKITESIK